MATSLGYSLEPVNVMNYIPGGSTRTRKKTSKNDQDMLRNFFYNNRKHFNTVNQGHPFIITTVPNCNETGIFVERDKKTIRLFIRNNSDFCVSLLNCFNLVCDQDITVYIDTHIKYPYPLIKGQILRIDLTICLSSSGQFEVPIAFRYKKTAKFKNCEAKLPYNTIVLNLIKESDIRSFLRPTVPYHRATRKSFNDVRSEKVIDGPKRGARKGVNTMDIVNGLPGKFPPPGLKELVQKDLKDFGECNSVQLNLLENIRDVLGTKENVKQLTRENYFRRFTHLMHIEEIQEKLDTEEFNMEKVNMDRCNDNGRWFFLLEVGEGLAEGRPSLMVGDDVQVYVLNALSHGFKDGWYKGKIRKVQLTSVLLQFNDKFHKLYQPTMKVNVKFIPTRFTYQLSHRALEFLKKHQMERIMLPTIRFPFSRDIPYKELKFVNKNIYKNPEQSQAVVNIVNRSSNKFPYLIFGPPGTGKTVTLVETILQNWLYDPESRRKQLVCASSNSAADLITVRLLNFKLVPVNKIFRMYSTSVAESQIHDTILENKECHNMYRNEDKDLEAVIPRLEQIMEKDIVITTIITAGRFVTGAIQRTHFSHILIDEAGHATEPECIVPIMGITTAPGASVSAQVVLAGDPQQLGPVLASVAEHYGLQTSLLERLMTTEPMYQKDPETKKFDSNVLSKLVRNFRSHPAILEVPNRSFYDNELQARGKPALINRFCNWALLPTKGFPIIFDGVVGTEERENTSPSFFNREEIDQILFYLKRLVGKNINGKIIAQTDIGIVSPYKKQIQKLSIALKKKRWTKITLGSVEQFQGDERLIIIVTTVRSQKNIVKKAGLGFLKNPKRFNVAITRAQSLLIIIGNPNALVNDENWGTMLKYCIVNGGYKGVPIKNLKITNAEKRLLLFKNKDLKEEPELKIVEVIPNITSDLSASMSTIDSAFESISINDTSSIVSSVQSNGKKSAVCSDDIKDVDNDSGSKTDVNKINLLSENRFTMNVEKIERKTNSIFPMNDKDFKIYIKKLIDNKDDNECYNASELSEYERILHILVKFPHIDIDNIITYNEWLTKIFFRTFTLDPNEIPFSQKYSTPDEIPIDPTSNTNDINIKKHDKNIKKITKIPKIFSSDEEEEEEEEEKEEEEEYINDTVSSDSFVDFEISEENSDKILISDDGLDDDDINLIVTKFSVLNFNNNVDSNNENNNNNKDLKNVFTRVTCDFFDENNTDEFIICDTNETVDLNVLAEKEISDCSTDIFSDSFVETNTVTNENLQPVNLTDIINDVRVVEIDYNLNVPDEILKDTVKNNNNNNLNTENVTKVLNSETNNYNECLDIKDKTASLNEFKNKDELKENTVKEKGRKSKHNKDCAVF